MRIRTISGDTLAAAMAKVREELGPEAIILHVEDAKSRKGVLVRAASDGAELGEPPQAPRHATALDHIETRLESELRERLRVFQPTHNQGERIDPQSEIAPALNFHRFPSALAADLVRISGEAAAASAEAALAHALERTIGCGPMPLLPARPIIAVGAAGHGKTTALARLAAQATAAGARVVLATLDTGKAGAVSQIETYAGLLKARLVVCEGENTLGDLASESTGDAIFIDTPGFNPWDPAEIAATRRWIERSGADPVWIASAEMDPRDLEECAPLYRGLGVRRMIATKLDISRRCGGTAAAAWAGRLAIAGLISSPYLAEGIEAPRHYALARRTLETFRASVRTDMSVQEAKIA